MASNAQWYATGRRKEATARVFLRPGNGRITVNHRDIDTYFERETLKMLLRQPLELTENIQRQIGRASCRERV